jgi:hypothetical protein
LAVDLDDWLPDPQVRSRHQRSSAADPDHLWHAAEAVLVCDAPLLGRAVRWRIPGTPAGMPYRELFRRYPFAVLDEGTNWSISGLCGRIWTIQRDYPHIHGADEFRAWSESGTVRVAIGHWIESGRDGRTALVSEARVKPVDRGAAIRLRALWTVVGGLERLIGGEALRAATRRAEADGRRRDGSGER